MRARYVGRSVAAGALFAAFFYGWSTGWKEETVNAPHTTPAAATAENEEKTGNGAEENERASNSADWPNWLGARLQEAVQAGQWSVAADYAYRLAVYNMSLGNQDAAKSWYQTGDGYWEKDPLKDRRFFDDTAPSPSDVTVSMYVSTPTSRSRPLAKFEPSSGAYLGMFGIGFSNDLSSIEKTFGRYHPIALTYAGWWRNDQDTRNYFPTSLVDRVKAAGGGAVQIGWEPSRGLDTVQDDDYVRGFARQAKAAGIPIFLRFASEMNGDWVPWYGDPQKYVEKFRLIATIMREEAPNVAMVWSPNYLPFDNIDPYYPGDEYVDWVGFSLYSTPFIGDKEDFSKNQIDYFEPLYEKYSYKPIMISEGGVSHYALKTNTSYEKWAEGQIGNMYGFLPRMFPDVKAITYFNMPRSRAESMKMDFVYDLKDSPVMYNFYQRLVQNDYFLTKIGQGESNPEQLQYVPIGEAVALQGKHRVFTYIRKPLDVQPYAVALFQGDRRLAVSYESPWEVEIDFSTLTPSEPLSVAVYNRKYEVTAQKTFQWK